jgi:hypothetical protein
MPRSQSSMRGGNDGADGARATPSPRPPYVSQFLHAKKDQPVALFENMSLEQQIDVAAAAMFREPSSTLRWRACRGSSVSPADYRKCEQAIKKLPRASRRNLADLFSGLKSRITP